jgi:aconitate hydratase
MGSLAIGAGGLDVAVAMGGGAFHLARPSVLAVELRGRLGPWVAAKDIILALLSILTTRGNVGAVVEYCGEGVAALSVPARATCANMGAELGVTTSIFPADATTRTFLAAQGRQDQFTPLSADDDAEYDRLSKRLDARAEAGVIERIRRHCPDARIGEPDADGMVPVSFSRVVIDLSELEPLAAAPGSPENIRTVAELAGEGVDQVLIGSCTNSSFHDLMVAAAVLKGRTVHPGVELGIAPGSRGVLRMLAANGALADMVAAGARILECACGPCIGQGFSPGHGRVSLRTFNRNFTGRSGTPDDRVYLVSPETAVAAAVTGRFTDPRELGVDYPGVSEPDVAIDDTMIVPPPAEGTDVEIVRGPTIVKPPAGQPLPDELDGEVLIKVGDRVTTDHIMPAGALMKYRSNVPEYAKHVFGPFNAPGEPTFAERAVAARQAGRAGVIVAGDSYGQGSSREHAALCPMYLGVRVVIARAIERIHQANLVNFAIAPLTFLDAGDYDRTQPGDRLHVDDVPAAIASAEEITVRNLTADFAFRCRVGLSPRQRKILAAGGLLHYTRQGGQ